MVETQKNKINVLHHCNQLSMGGTEKTLQIFCKYLDKNSFNLFIASKKGGIREKILRKAGFPVFRYYSTKNLKKIFIKNNIDVLHLHRAGSPEPEPIIAAKEAGVKKIIETCVFGFDDNSTSFQYIDKRLFVSRWIFWRSKVCLKEGWWDKYRVLYNPIEYPKTNDNLRQHLGIKDYEIVIGRLSRASEEKYHDIGIKFIENLKQENIKFLIMNPTPRIKKIIKRLNFKNKVIYLKGSIDPLQLSLFYNTIDMLTHSCSLGESFGCVIAEAMIHGKPVITHLAERDQAQIELVDNGKGGFVVGYNDYSSYNKAVNYLVENDKTRKEFGEHNKLKSLKYYEAGLLTKYLEDIYFLELGIKKETHTIFDQKFIESFIKNHRQIESNIFI